MGDISLVVQYVGGFFSLWEAVHEDFFVQTKKSIAVCQCSDVVFLDVILMAVTDICMSPSECPLTMTCSAISHLLATECGLALALAFALCPEVAAHTPKSITALGVLDLGVRSAEISPSCAPFIGKFTPFCC
jgi:hypothetical protein